MCANRTDPIPSNESLLELLSVVSRKLRTLFDARVRQEGLTLARARALMNLSKHRQLTQRELAILLEIEGPTLVRLLDKLEEQGWINRQAVEGDRRAKHVTLTREGEAMSRRVFALAETLRDDVLRGMTPEQIEVTSKTLSLLGANVASFCVGLDGEL